MHFFVKGGFCFIFKGSATVNSTSNKKEEEEEYDGFCKPAKFLKQGSVLDILKSPGEIMNSFKMSFAENTLLHIAAVIFKKPSTTATTKKPQTICHSYGSVSSKYRLKRYIC